LYNYNKSSFHGILLVDVDSSSSHFGERSAILKEDVDARVVFMSLCGHTKIMGVILGHNYGTFLQRNSPLGRPTTRITLIHLR
jgi:hypothetical protein